MDDTAHYFHLGDEALNKLEGLLRQRESLETEIMKVEQFVAAPANTLSGEHKDALLRRLSLTQELFRLREVGLTDAIRGILRISGTDWLTVTQVRDRMVSLGFDFSTYSSNPLASVSAVLRRFPPEEVERTTIDGVAAFRWKEGEASAAKWAAIQRGLKGGPPPPPGLTKGQVIESLMKKKN